MPGLLALILAAASSGAAAVGALYFGEGDGSPPPDNESRQFLESQPHLGEPWPEAAIPEPSPEPEPRPETARPAPPRPRDAFLPRDPAAQRYAERWRDAVREPPHAGGASGPGPSASPAPERYSLWDGLGEPLALPADKVSELPADRASALGRSDYESLILGRRALVRAAEEALVSELPDQAPAGELEGGAEPGMRRPGELFVAVDIEAEPDRLQDAVAALGGAAAFRADPRFPVAPGAQQSSTVWGWLPAGRVGEAVGVPGVKRLHVEPGAARAPARSALTAEMVVGLRAPLPDEGGAGQGAAALDAARRIEELARATGLRWKRTVGYQRLPGPPEDPSPRGALVIVGEIPVKDMARLMAHPGVLKVMPALPPPPAPAPAQASRPTSFLSFVFQRAPLLLVATLALLIPPVGAFLLRGLRVFVPYE